MYTINDTVTIQRDISKTEILMKPMSMIMIITFLSTTLLPIVGA